MGLLVTFAFFRTDVRLAGQEDVFICQKAVIRDGIPI